MDYDVWSKVNESWVLHGRYKTRLTAMKKAKRLQDIGIQVQVYAGKERLI